MKNIFLSCFLLFVFTFSFGQTTWVQKMSMSIGYHGFSDQEMGVKDAVVGADGDLYILGRTNQDSYEELFKVSPDGKQFRWHVLTGGRDTHQGSFSTYLSATADSGVLLTTNYCLSDLETRVDGMVKKIFKTGDADTVFYRPGIPWTANEFEVARDAVEKTGGGYWVLVKDSLYGTGVAPLPISGKRMHRMSNGDLIIQSLNNMVIRIDTLGNIIWSVPCNQSSVLGFSQSHIFVTVNGLIKKLDAMTGVALWNKPEIYPFSHVDATLDGGYVASCGIAIRDTFGFPTGQIPGYIVRADSSGDTLWTRKYDFPYAGLSFVKSLPDGSLLTGGCYLRSNLCFNFYFPLHYGGFYATLDSIGRGILEQTSYMWPGDADNNQIVDFVNDAPYMVIANGVAGLMRDTINAGFFNGCSGDFASDWSNFFSNGVNYKHADYDGNGVIDTIDVIQLIDFMMFEWGDSISIPFPFKFAKPNSGLTSVPEFKLIPDADTVASGSDVQFNIIAGSSAVPIDSICGLSFAFTPTSNAVTVVSTTMSNSDLGIIGNNLFARAFPIYNTNFRYDALTCRTDHQLAYNLFDTLGVITANENSGVPSIIQLSVIEFKAMTCDGTDIPFNITSQPVVVIPGYVSVEEKNESRISVYPNPAIRYIYISTGNNSKKHIEILNTLGQKMKEIVSSEKTVSISTHDLTTGIYNLTILSDNVLRHFSVVVQH